MSKLNPDAVICNAAVETLERIREQMRTSGAGSQFLRRLVRRQRDREGAKEEAAGVIMAQVCPADQEGYPGGAEYQAAMAAWAPSPTIVLGPGGLHLGEGAGRGVEASG